MTTTLSQTPQASGDLTSLTAVKQYMGLTGTADDQLLLRLISSASQYFKDATNRGTDFDGVLTYNEVRDGNNSDVIVTSHWPIVSVTSVQVGLTIVPQSPDNIQFGWTNDDVSIILIGYNFNYVAGLQVGTSGYTRGRKNIKLTYSAGYATVPFEVEQAVIELAALRYKERIHIGVDSISIHGTTTQYFKGDLPPSVQGVINKYAKRIWA